jgi:hypothetical protein
VTVQRQLVEVAATPRLTPRQARVWALVCKAPGGLTATEVGQLLHCDKEKHHADFTCQWCEAEGLSVLRSKALRPLVIRRRATGRWEPREKADRTVDRGSQLDGLPEWLGE